MHPINKDDAFRVVSGANINGMLVKYDGWYFSDDYIKEIIDLKVKES